MVCGIVVVDYAIDCVIVVGCISLCYYAIDGVIVIGYAIDSIAVGG